MWRVLLGGAEECRPAFLCRVDWGKFVWVQVVCRCSM